MRPEPGEVIFVNDAGLAQRTPLVLAPERGSRAQRVADTYLICAGQAVEMHDEARGARRSPRRDLMTSASRSIAMSDRHEVAAAVLD